jgi:serine phosphatase RsbU (regulator of sigma subunit)
MNNYLNKFFLLLFLLIITSGFCKLYSNDALKLNNNFQRELLSNHLDVFQEKETELTIDDIAGEKYLKKFTRITYPEIDLDLTGNRYWFRFSLHNESGSDKKYIIEFDNPYLNSLEFYDFDENNNFTLTKSGSKYPFNSRKHLQRKIIFETFIKNGETKNYYFNIEPINSTGFYCAVSEYNYFFERESINRLILGVFAGILLTVILFNITVFFMSGNVSYLYFALFSICFTFFLTNESGYSFQYIWPDTPEINQWSKQTIGTLSLIFFFLFSQKFLHLKKLIPRINKMITVLFLISLVFITGLGLIHSKFMLKGLEYGGRIFPVIFLIISIVVLKKKYKPARIYLFSFLFITIASMLYYLSIVSIIPFKFAIVMLFFTALIISVTTMGFSLLDKYIMINKELALDRDILKERNELINNELQLAENIQHRLIPEKSPVENIHAIYYPIDKIGGDFYDFISFRDSEKIGIFISDVSGHGVPAAFVTMLIKSMVLQAGELREDPAKLLWFLNNSLFHLTAENFATCFYGIYDKATNHLLYSNAGHPSPLIIKDGKIKELEGEIEVPIAMWNEEEIIELGKVYQNDETYLEPDSKLLLFTDGLPDTRMMSNKKKFYKEERMTQVLSQNSNLKAKDYLISLMQDLISFREGYVFDDDICIICVDV